MLATDTKALSEEIALLFTEIQQQAQLYAELMQVIRQQADESKRSTDKLLLDAQKLKTASDKAIEAVELQAKQTIQQVSDKAQSLEMMFQELHTVRKTQHDVHQLIQQLAKKKSEFETFLRSADATLQHRIHEKFRKIDSAIKHTTHELRQEIAMLSIHLEKVTDTQNRNIANVENNFDEFRSRIGEIKFLVSQSNELSENIKKLVILTVKDQTKEIIKSVKQEDEIFANKINKGEKQTSQYNANGKKEITNSDLLDDALNEQPQKEQQKQSQQQQPYLQQEMLEEMQGLRRQLGEMKNALKKSESKIEAAKKAGVISGVLTGALALCLGLIF